MAFKWRQIRVFGLSLALPFLALVAAEIAEHQRAAFLKAHQDMADCSRCHKLFNVRAGMSFILHLRDEHKLNEEQAIDIVEHLYRKLLIKKEHHRRQHEAAKANIPHA